jgi:hypothetical protein
MYYDKTTPGFMLSEFFRLNMNIKKSLFTIIRPKRELKMRILVLKFCRNVTNIMIKADTVTMWMSCVSCSSFSIKPKRYSHFCAHQKGTKKRREIAPLPPNLSTIVVK